MVVPPKIQIKRTATPNWPPGGLMEGELCVEMNNPTRLWVGVPTNLDVSGKKLLFDSGSMGNYYTKPEADALFVQVPGDTMTGYLTLNADPVNPLHAATKQYVDLKTPTVDLSPYVIRAGDTMLGFLTANADPQAPLHYATKQYVDANTGVVGNFVRITGDVMTGDLTTTGLVVAPGFTTTTGQQNNGNFSNVGDMNILGAASLLYCQNAANISGRCDVYAMTHAHASITVDGVVDIFNNGPGSRVNCNGYATAGTEFYLGLIQGNPNWDNVALLAANWVSIGQAGFRMAVGGSSLDFRNNGKGYCVGGGSWLNVSDARIKNVLGDYTSGLDAITALRPVRYSYKGNDTMGAPAPYAMGREPQEGEPRNDDPPAVPYPNSFHHEVAVEGREFIGLIAQEAEVPMPEIVAQRGGYIDGAAVTDMREMDTSPLVFALINAVKELKAINDTLTTRVTALETQLATGVR